MEKSRLFQYAIIWNPSKDQVKSGLVPLVLVDVTNVLAQDEKAALIMASRAIPQSHINELNQIDIALRPF